MAEQNYTLTVKTNRGSLGKVNNQNTVTFTYPKGTAVNLSAVAVSGIGVFDAWSDGDTNATREYLIKDKDEILTAYFYKAAPNRNLLDVTGLAYVWAKIKAFFASYSSGGSGASRIGLSVADTTFTKTNVQEALEEVKEQADSNTNKVSKLEQTTMGSYTEYVIVKNNGNNVYIPVKKDTPINSSKTYGLLASNGAFVAKSYSELIATSSEDPEKTVYEYYRDKQLLRMSCSNAWSGNIWNSNNQEGFIGGMPHSGIAVFQTGYSAGGEVWDDTINTRLIHMGEGGDVEGWHSSCFPIVKGHSYRAKWERHSDPDDSPSLALYIVFFND